jgi:hypothetical protein
VIFIHFILCYASGTSSISLQCKHKNFLLWRFNWRSILGLIRELKAFKFEHGHAQIKTVVVWWTATTFQLWLWRGYLTNVQTINKCTNPPMTIDWFYSYPLHKIWLSGSETKFNNKFRNIFVAEAILSFYCPSTS